MLSGNDIPNTNDMYLVVDPNVVISALIKVGSISNVFSLNATMPKFSFIAPNFLILEIGNNTRKIMERTYLSKEALEREIVFLMKQIMFVSEEEYQDKRDEAKKMLKGHEKDIPYLALALKFNCKIFSGDKTLKAIIPEKVITPNELLAEF